VQDNPSLRERLAFYQRQAEKALRDAVTTFDKAERDKLLNACVAWNQLARQTEEKLASQETPDPKPQIRPTELKGFP